MKFLFKYVDRKHAFLHFKLCMNLHNYSKYLIKLLELKFQNFACKTNKLCILLKEKACRFALAESVIRGT